jgi:hypothetical protein
VARKSIQAASNFSVFDEENALFITENSWSLGFHLLGNSKDGVQNLIDIIQDHVTVVKDYSDYNESGTTTAEKLLALIRSHSNKFCHLTQIRPQFEPLSSISQK